MGEEERAAQYLRYVRSGINLQVKNCLNVVNRLMTSKDGDDADNRDRDAALKELRTGLAEYIRAEADLEDSLKALQLLRERMRPLQDNDEEVDVDKMYKEIREGVARTLSEVDVEKHKAMTEFDLKCSRREEGGDTETEEGGEVVATQVIFQFSVLLTLVGQIQFCPTCFPGPLDYLIPVVSFVN